MPPTIILPVLIVCLYPPLSVDTVPFHLITAGSKRWKGRQTDRQTRHPPCLSPPLLCSVWPGCVGEVPTQGRGFGGGGSQYLLCPVVMTHSWRSRRVTGSQSHRLQEETLRGRRPAIDTRRQTDRWTDRQTVRWLLRLLDRQQINPIAGLTARELCLNKLLMSDVSSVIIMRKFTH